MIRPVAIAQALSPRVLFLLIRCSCHGPVGEAGRGANSIRQALALHFAGTWGNHEGSMLLGYVDLPSRVRTLLHFERRLPSGLCSLPLQAQVRLSLGFYASFCSPQIPERLNPRRRGERPNFASGSGPGLPNQPFPPHTPHPPPPPPPPQPPILSAVVAFSFAVGP